jgi:hypothetical protein
MTFIGHLRHTKVAPLPDKDSHETESKATKKLPSPMIVNRKGRATLYGRFAHAVPQNLALGATTTEQDMLGISNLHPLEDPTLVGPHTMIPIIRRGESDSSWSVESSEEEIHPFHRAVISANVKTPRFEKAHLVGSPGDTPNSAATVAGLILQFETLGTRPPAMKIQYQQPRFRAKIPIAQNYQISLELFLAAIGEAPPAIISPKLVRIATEWHQTVEFNQVTQLGDSSHVSLSSSLNLLGAALDPTCANLDVQGIEEVALLRAVSHKRVLRGLV